MRVAFRRSGGIAGIDLTASVDTEELPPGQARLAAELLNPSSAPAAPSTGSPDAFSYELTVDDGSRVQTHRWNESDVPEAVQPLLAGLRDRAQPAPPT